MLNDAFKSISNISLLRLVYKLFFQLLNYWDWPYHH